MRKGILVFMLALASALPATAGEKIKGTTKLEDLQPAGTADKENKNQMYDFLFISSGNRYTCRTSRKTELKATDFVVGNDVRFEIDGDKVKLKSMAGKETKCKVVRVENVGIAPAATPR